ncbi:hypothetical protein FSARC_13851 [Fusarium sarcochroum]|uniref:Uncharacterized protein n=1 Tax=Fusarium sarcochroum TaxID=1208366 RepID=A0A8H4WRE6_9HYPO|nr:hypothetical protein FSARC_13851 [Fusarium sarcochroum]
MATSQSNSKSISQTEPAILKELRSVILPAHDDTIWSGTALQGRENEVNAAMYSIASTQREQPVYFTARQNFESTENRFLDRLALLFAHKKKRDTHLHVTATGLATDDSNVYVIVAKSDGLAADEDFRAELEYWFRSKDQNTTVECRAVINFWEDRLRFYINEFKKVNDKTWNLSKKSGPMWKIFALNAPDSRRPKTCAKALFFRLWQRPSRHDYRGPLTRLESKSTDDSLQNYLKLIRFLELLAMPEAIWQALLECQEKVKSKGKKVHIVPVQKVDLATRYTIPEKQLHDQALLDTVALVETLKGWAGEDVSSTSALLDAKILCYQYLSSKRPLSPNGKQLVELEGDLMSERARLDGFNEPEQIEKRQRLSNALRSAKVPRTHKYLHCELQILMVLQQVQSHYQLNLHDFIGCSKLSCYMCWEMLKTSHYKTRGTHGNIYSL